MAFMTKAELEKENGKLKQALVDLEDSIKKLQNAKKTDLPSKTSVVFINDNNEFKIVDIAFNPQAGVAEVLLGTERDVAKNNRSYEIAFFVSKKLLSDYMTHLGKKFKGQA